LGLGGVRHLDKAKAAWAAGVSIGDNSGRLDGPIGLKEVAELFLCGRKREIVDVDLHAYPLKVVAVARLLSDKSWTSIDVH